MFFDDGVVEETKLDSEYPGENQTQARDVQY
jgi:hypothetical protein